jgi:type IV secretion system protein VirB10
VRLWGKPESGARSAEPGRGSPERRADGQQTVAGERSIAAVHRVRSLESRVGNILALGLICALGSALLAWYYSAALRRPARAARSAEALTASRAQTEMPLPPLGPIPEEGPPILHPNLGGPRPAAATAALAAPPARPTLPALPALAALPTLPTLPAQPLAAVNGPTQPSPYALMGAPAYALQALVPSLSGWKAPVPSAYGETPAPSLHRGAFERRLSGPVFARQSDSNGAAGSPGSSGPTQASGPEASAFVAPFAAASATPPASPPAAVPASMGTASADALGQLLRPSPTPAASPLVLPTRSLLLPKGTFIDCTLETAIDSTLPGMTTCITATDTFGADGKVVLLERGSKLIGETRGEVQQGSARIFVLWTEARTPTGVVIPLASPGTDELGRAGLAGEVNRHFWQRFGAAILVTIIDAGAESAVQSGNGTVIYDPTATQDVTSEVLKDTLHIPPTVVKNQGDRIQVLVARDLDFRSVYELRASAQP